MRDPMLAYAKLDLTSPESIADYARLLPGMTFRDVLGLGIAPDGVDRAYNARRYKGGMGTLLEERFFGYRANSDRGPDFRQARVELKVTCLDRRKDGGVSAGERLVLTMVPFDGPIEADLYFSHVWEKCSNILLVVYERDRGVDPYDQRIVFATMFTPPPEDLRIIEEDYRKIASIVRAGRAEELSEGLTSYLGACTKGASEATMWTEQHYPPHSRAKRRAFCFKRKYMDYVLHHYVMGQHDDAEPIVGSVSDLDGTTFEGFVLEKINRCVGMSDRALCEKLGLEYTGNKAQWTKIAYALLGVRGEAAEEFKKANVSVRAVRVEERGGVRESLSLETISFADLVDETWEKAPLKAYFEETRFLFVSFRAKGGCFILEGARFWSMPPSDIEGPLRACWQQAQDTVRKGVELTVVSHGSRVRVENDLPKMKDNPVAHVRPHASRSWYRFEDGTTIGDSPSHGDVLPDGREMTKQSFWLNGKYVYGIVCPDHGRR